MCGSMQGTKYVCRLCMFSPLLSGDASDESEQLILVASLIDKVPNLGGMKQFRVACDKKFSSDR